MLDIMNIGNQFPISGGGIEGLNSLPATDSKKASASGDALLTSLSLPVTGEEIAENLAKAKENAPKGSILQRGGSEKAVAEFFAMRGTYTV